MKEYSNSLNIPSIDSLKWRIPLDEVDVLNTNLLDHIINVKTNTSTGEVIEEIPIQSNSLKSEFQDYHIHFAINKIFGDKFLVVLINSKLLEHECLNGISMTNIEPIYNQIMSCKVFYCSFEDFLSKGMVSDIDIKKDILITEKDFRETISQLEKGSKSHRRTKHGCNPFKEKDNLGIEWNTRAGASYTHPFLKVYHKGIEARFSKNRQFFANYIDIDSQNVVDRVRIECTIKSFREAQKHGFQDNTLLTLLKANTEHLNAIIQHSVTSNLEPRLKKVERRTKDRLNNTELITFLYLTELIKEKGVSFENALFHILEHQECKVQRARLKKSLTAVYEEQIKGEKFEVKSKRISSFFDSLGWS
jgi:hypothetical protein